MIWDLEERCYACCRKRVMLLVGYYGTWWRDVMWIMGELTYHLLNAVGGVL